MQEITNEKFFENNNKSRQQFKLSFGQDNEDGNLEKKIINFNKKFLLNNKENIRNLDINNSDLKNNEESKVFQRSDYKFKTIAHHSDHRKFTGMKTIPQTSIEKIVKTMNKIKGKLLQYEEKELVAEVEWAIKEILSDNMYKIKLHEKTSKEESDFYNEYSNNKSELILANDISNYGRQKLNDSPNLKPDAQFSPSDQIFPKIDDFGPEFDVFDFSNKIGRENLLMNVSIPVFQYKNINKYINFSKFPEFINQIRIGYSSFPDAFYHSDFHSADVLQTELYFCNNCKFDEVMQLDGIDILSLFFSALVHDYKHPGFTNLYLIQTFSDISRVYNDKSPLENYHLSETFNLLSNKNMNIFDKMKIELFKILRKRTIECVLSTDMALHSKIFGQISSKLTYFQECGKGQSLIDFFTEGGNNCSKFDVQQEFMNYILHVGDIAHPAKPWTIELKWSDLIFKEFFNQGDKERVLSLPISFLCDRDSTSIPKSQIGFIKNIIMPSFSLVLTIIPASEEMNNFIFKNLEKWMLLEDEENSNKKTLTNNNYISDNNLKELLNKNQLNISFNLSKNSEEKNKNV